MEKTPPPPRSGSCHTHIYSDPDIVGVGSGPRTPDGGWRVGRSGGPEVDPNRHQCLVPTGTLVQVGGPGVDKESPGGQKYRCRQGHRCRQNHRCVPTSDTSWTRSGWPSVSRKPPRDLVCRGGTRGGEGSPGPSERTLPVPEAHPGVLRRFQ